MTGTRPERVALAAARVLERSEFDAATGCRLWTGPVQPQGYPCVVRIPGEQSPVRPHRVVAEWALGEAPAGMHADHLCHTEKADTCPGGPSCPHRLCVTPEHMEFVTPIENVRRGTNGNRSACKRGHPFDDQNTGTNGASGWRYCKACRSERDRAKAA